MADLTGRCSLVQQPPSWEDVTLEYERRVEPFTLLFANDMLSSLSSSSSPTTSSGRRRQSQRLLDVGCGPGGCALMAADASMGFSVTATDVSTSMIDRARKRAAENCAEAMECVVTDGQSLPAEWTSTFDCVVANFSVIFFQDPSLGLQEIYRCLKSSGRVALSAWGDTSETPAFQIFVDAASHVVPSLASEGKPRRIIGSRDSLTSLLEHAGFVDIEVVGPVKHTLKLDSPEQYYLRFALASPPTIGMISKMDSKTAETLKEKVKELARERGGQPDGSIAIDSSAYFAYGSKP